MVVYCEDCKYYSNNACYSNEFNRFFWHSCTVKAVWQGNSIKRKASYCGVKDCTIINPDNKCVLYKRKWWKFWR